MARKHQQPAKPSRKQEDEGYRPFKNLKLVERTETAHTPAKKPARKNGAPIVGGYDQNADFGDILAAFEAGEDVAAVSKDDRVRSRVQDSRPFSEIFAEWEESQGIAPKKPKPKVVPIKKSAPYKQTKDFGDILASFEGRPAPRKERPVPTAVKKPAAPVEKPRGAVAQQKSTIKTSGKSFGDLLAQYEGRAVPDHSRPAPAPVKKEEPKPTGAELAERMRAEEEARRNRQVAELTADGVKWAGDGLKVVVTDVAHRQPQPEPKQQPQEAPKPSEVKASGKDFGEILDAFYGKRQKPEAGPILKDYDTSKLPPVPEPEPESHGLFDDLYRQWSTDHDENAAIRHAREEKPEGVVRHYTIQQLRGMLPLATKDLHGYTEEEAMAEAVRFLEESYRQGILKICIITGKGIHSEDGVPVVKQAVESVLHGSAYVREFTSPKARYGGSGALWIILKERE